MIILLRLMTILSLLTTSIMSMHHLPNVAPEDGEIDTDILLIKDDVLREKLLKINLLIAKIEALNADPNPSSDFVLKSPSPVEDGDSFLEKFETTPELETFKFDIEEKNSGSTTIHADISLSDLECVYFKSEPDPGDFDCSMTPMDLLVTGWRVCIDYQKLNDATRKDHFPLPFMDQMLERLAGNEYYCFLDGFSGYFQIPIDPLDQEKTTFTCPYGTFAYRRMPFGLCNAPGTFQRCMVAIFHDMIEKTMEVFMDDFSVFGDSFSSCLSYLDKMLQRCEDTNLVLNWEMEKRWWGGGGCHLMVKRDSPLGNKISKSGIEVDKAKVDVMQNYLIPLP
ncbi:reverse transcriptase domain-containing protein [Tanacetum coccineum]